MRTYFFVLGKNPALSVSELRAVLDSFSSSFTLICLSHEVAVFRFVAPIDVPKVMKQLGGTVKMGEILDSSLLSESEDFFFRIISADNLLDRYFPKLRKIHFGLSLYNASSELSIFSQLKAQQKSFLIHIKKSLQEKGASAGFLRVKDRFLSSVSVAKNSLLTKGAEIVLILTPESILVGKTLAVFEFESFTLRDFYRPKKDKRSGIMPPKLARILLNISGVGANGVVLDPYCGSGTVIQEAVILGHRNIIASDISGKAISDTRSNLEWIFEHYKSLDQSLYRIKIFQTDVNFLSRQIPPDSVDAIVTEPYLGPPFHKLPDQRIINSVLSELNKLYLASFGEFHNVLKPEGTVVVIFPVFSTQGKSYFLEILDGVRLRGFTFVPLLKSSVANYFPSNISKRGTIVYGSPKQFVRREILVFKKSA